MANEQELFGLPQININFKTKSITAIKRSARGIVAMILHNETSDTSKVYKISDVSDIPATGLTDANVDLIKKCLLGTPLRILVYTLPDSTVESPTNTQATVLKLLQQIKCNYIVAPTATGTEQEDLASWIKAKRDNDKKTFKAVCAHQAADHEGVINFCTENIKTADKTYTALQYTARIAGILAGLSLDRSATYYTLSEVVSCDVYEDLETRIDKGELHVFDEQDDMGVKIARACNSLTTFTTDHGQKFRKIKIIEAKDFITDDIRDTFKKYYVGKIINDYPHKMLFIAAILVYLNGLKGNVLDVDAENSVSIDYDFQRNYAILDGADVDNLTEQEIIRYNTGDEVGLVGNIKLVDAMENLTINFTM